MAEITKETTEKKEEAVMSPVGSPKKNNGLNKDGFVAGQIVTDKEYQLAMAKARQKK